MKNFFTLISLATVVHQKGYPQIREVEVYSCCTVEATAHRSTIIKPHMRGEDKKTREC